MYIYRYIHMHTFLCMYMYMYMCMYMGMYMCMHMRFLWFVGMSSCFNCFSARQVFAKLWKTRCDTAYAALKNG